MFFRKKQENQEIKSRVIRVTYLSDAKISISKLIDAEDHEELLRKNIAIGKVVKIADDVLFLDTDLGFSSGDNVFAIPKNSIIKVDFI